MKKILNIILVLFLTFVLTACNNNKANETTNGNTNNDNKSQVKDKADSTTHENYVPQKAVPDNLPVYPGAILWNDNETWAAEGTNWMWFYNTTGTANEIIDFFTTELQNLGFEINPKFTFANREEFFVRDMTMTVEIGWLDDGIKDANPDTPGRGYMIIVNLDQWNKR